MASRNTLVSRLLAFYSGGTPKVSVLRGDAALFPGAVVQASVREEKKLMVENAKLRNDIEELKKQLLEKERQRGGRWGKFPLRRQRAFVLDVDVVPVVLP